MMAGLKRTTLSGLMGCLVRFNGQVRSIKVNYQDKGGHACPGRKPAWILGFDLYRDIKIYIYFLINNFFSHARNRVCKRGCPFCPVYSIRAVFDWLGYHNAVATEVAVMEVANA